MSYWSVASLAISAIGTGVSAYQGNKSAKEQSRLLEEEQKNLQSAQAGNEAFLNAILGRSVQDYQSDALESNLRSFPQIKSLIQRFGGVRRSEASADTANATENMLRAAALVGVDPRALNTELISSGRRTMQDGQYLTERGKSLIDGDYYNTAVGQQWSSNILRKAAEGSTVGGKALIGRMGEETGDDEIDMITAFLLNGQENARYGDNLMSLGSQVTQIGAGRLGGVLQSGMQFGQTAFGFGSQMADRDVSIGATQLIDPNMAYQSDAFKANILGSILSENARSAGLLGQAQAGVTAQNSANNAQAIGGITSALGSFAQTQSSKPKTTGSSSGGSKAFGVETKGKLTM